jgi:hypothetical protein
MNWLIQISKMSLWLAYMSVTTPVMTTFITITLPPSPADPFPDWPPQSPPGQLTTPNLTGEAEISTL